MSEPLAEPVEIVRFADGSIMTADDFTWENRHGIYEAADYRHDTVSEAEFQRLMEE